MKVIHKQSFPISDTIVLVVPADSEILKFDLQNQQLTVWYAFNKDLFGYKESLTLHIVGTGHEFWEGWKYIDTVQTPPFVWHLFEESKRCPV